MGDAIVGILIIGILSISIRKVISEKKKGVKCIGCPQGRVCAKKSECQESDIVFKK